MVRPVGINHVALEVGDVDAALEWYGRFLQFELRGKRPGMAWIDLGDQFLALSKGPDRPVADDGRHFGLVVDDKGALRAAMREAGVPVADSGSLHLRDPWGNVVECVDYREIQFSKTPAVLDGMGQAGLEKSEAARAELRAKGLGG